MREFSMYTPVNEIQTDHLTIIFLFLYDKDLTAETQWIYDRQEKIYKWQISECNYFSFCHSLADCVWNTWPLGYTQTYTDSTSERYVCVLFMVSIHASGCVDNFPMVDYDYSVWILFEFIIVCVCDRVEVYIAYANDDSAHAWRGACVCTFALHRSVKLVLIWNV